MQRVDDDATFNRTEHGYNGFKDILVWTKNRTIPTGWELMEWRIEDDSTTATKEYLSCSTIQPAISGPPGTLQDAVHDFSAKYTTPAPAGTFEPPAGVE